MANSVEPNNDEAMPRTLASHVLAPAVIRSLAGRPGDIVFILGNDFRPVWSSNENGFLFGLRTEEWQSGTLSEIIHPDDRAWVRQLRQELLTTADASIRAQVRIEGADGTYSPVLLMATNHFDDPEINGLVVTVRHITANVPTSPDVQHDEYAGAEAIARQGAQLDKLTSEIRFSVATISESADALSNDASLQPAQRLHAITIGAATQTVEGLLEDLGQVSGPSIEIIDLDPVVFSPSHIVDGVAAAFRPTCAEEGLTLSLRFDDDIPGRVKGDPVRLARVLQHVISSTFVSAVAGSVCVEARAIDNGKLRFWVSDNGRGIPAEMPATAHGQAWFGAASGLKTAGHLVEQLGGSLFHQTNTEGTAFWFDVMFGHARRTEDLPVQPPVPTAKATAHVLVVDDSEVNRLLATSQLERLGYTFSTAKGGQEALDLLASRPFDAVLMDWHMPGMDGLDATRQWRAQSDPNHRLPIISMTASAMAGDRERCIEAGASDYLSKPVSITDLGSMLSRWTRTQEPIEAPDVSRPERDSKISALIADLGDIGVVRSIVGAFLGMVPQYRDSASAALDREDRETIRRCAHTLKSTALMLGTGELAEACITLEAAAGTDTLELVAPLAEFVRCCTEAEAVLLGLAAELETIEGPLP